ncbi:hypothetical protein HDU96_000633, partial [Phlyctochytrium bullatum]
YYAQLDVEDYDSNGGSNYAVVAQPVTLLATPPGPGGIVRVSAFSLDATTNTLTVDLWVYDHAFQKSATVFYSSSTGDFTVGSGAGSLVATFVATTLSGWQLWRAQGVLPAATAGVGSRFYVRATVTDFDTNGGENYLLPYVPPKTVTSTVPGTSTVFPTDTTVVPPTETTAVPTETTVVPPTETVTSSTVAPPPTTTTAPPTPTPILNIAFASAAYDPATTVFAGDIVIRNLAFNKQVALYYSVPGATSFVRVAAGYRAPIADGTNRETWSFAAPIREASPETQYYAELVVDDYDSNGGANYAVVAGETVAGATVPAGGNVAVKKFALVGKTLSGELWVKDNAFNKAATVFYSDANGDFGKGNGQISATFGQVAEGGWQVWKFESVLGDAAGVGSKFYVQYTVKDYDNNNGLNYLLPFKALPTSTLVIPTTTAVAPTTTGVPVTSTITELPTTTTTTAPTFTATPYPRNVVVTNATYERSGLFYGELSLRNIAFNKVVNVFYSLNDNGDDFSAGLYIPASYVRSEAGGKEVWGFKSVLVRPGPNTKYFAEYYVEDFDGNGGSNYPITATPATPNPRVPSATGPNILPKSYTLNGTTLSGELWVKDVDFEKTATVFYSTADGRDYPAAFRIDAKFASFSDNGYQVWKFEGNLDAKAGAGSRFYLKYSVKAFDNNGGKNYNLKYLPPVTTTTASPTTTTPVPTSTRTTRPTETISATPSPVPPPPTLDGNDLIRLRNYNYDPVTNLLTGLVYLKVPVPKASDPLPRATFTIWCTNDNVPWDGGFRAIPQRRRAVSSPDEIVPAAAMLAMDADMTPITTPPPPTTNVTVMLYPFTVRRCGPGFGAHFYATVNGDDEGTLAKILQAQGLDNNGGYSYRLFLPDRKAGFGWKGRSVYQLLTDRFATSVEDDARKCDNLRNYCGGTFKGITRNLDYLKDMGFDAIWISNVVAQDNEGYHGYYPYNLYQINPKFGSSDDLKALIAAAKSKDILVMVDIVANHLGAHNISSYSDFPAPFGALGDSAFHRRCDIDYGNQTSVEQCWLARTLPDLDTERPEVVTALYDWISWLFTNYAFDGLRIDTAKHVRIDFWPGFVAKAGNTFTLGEVLTNDIPFSATYQTAMGSVLNYPGYYGVYRGVWEGRKSLWSIEQQLASDRAFYADTSVLGTFLDNHDQPRFADLNNDPTALRNALALMAFTDGIPITYYGTELFATSPGQGDIDPRNREPLWDLRSRVGATADSREVKGFTQTLMRARRQLVVGSRGADFVGARHEPLLTLATVHAFRKGDAVVVVSSLGKSGNATIKVKVPFGRRVLRDIVSTWKTYTADANGEITLSIVNGEPIVLFADA